MREQFCNLNAVDVLVIINQGFLELTFKEKQTIFLNLCQKLQELDAPKPK
ncbi:ribonuclease P protein component-like protein [Mycoplasmoides pneumoniae FH]|nr:ribonuclease P protein component-like protein [Mycoplasmoides pneumoniae FH]